MHLDQLWQELKLVRTQWTCNARTEYISWHTDATYKGSITDPNALNSPCRCSDKSLNMLYNHNIQLPNKKTVCISTIIVYPTHHTSENINVYVRNYYFTSTLASAPKRRHEGLLAVATVAHHCPCRINSTSRRCADCA